MSNVTADGINVHVPTPGIQNDSRVIKENFYIIQQLLKQYGDLIAKLQALIGYGVTGPVGSDGPLGPTGPQGIQGFQGPQGAQGLRGLIGPQGDTGPQGLQGPTGAPSFVPGPPGPASTVTGPMGPTGAPPDLPIATHVSLGGVIVGNNLTVDSSGTIDINGEIINNLENVYPIEVARLPGNIVYYDAQGRYPAADGSQIYNLNVPMPFMTTGLAVTRLTYKAISVGPGVCTDSTYTRAMVNRRTYILDITRSGIGGLDIGSATEGTSYFPYVIYNPTTKAVDMVLSASVNASQVLATLATQTATVGYTFARKLGWGFVYNTSIGGIPKVVTTGWPNPTTRFVNSEATTDWYAGGSTDYNTWIPLNLSKFIPSNSRYVYLYCTAGYGLNGAYISSTGTGTGLNVGSEFYGIYWTGPVYIWIATDENQNIYYRNEYGAQFSAWVLGYATTEVI